MNVFEMIDYEHRLILDILHLAQQRILACVASGNWAAMEGQEVIEFCQYFIGRNHRQKEELLFNLLLQKNRAYLTEPIAGFRDAHGQFRSHLEALNADARRMAAGEIDVAQAMVQRLAKYVQQAQDHLEKEDRFYCVVSELLNEDDHRALATAFQNLEQTNLGPTGHDYYCQWAQRMASSGR